jgi:hypothetical protein
VRHFVVDASSLIPFIANSEPRISEYRTKRAIEKLLTLRSEKKAELHVPNICLAECSKAFAKLSYGSGGNAEKARDGYRKWVEDLLELVSTSRKGYVKPMAFDREHLVDIEEIFIAERRLPRERNPGELSGVDAVVISMGRQLALKHGLHNVFVVSQDRWLVKVCNRSEPLFVRAIDSSTDPIPDG